MEFRHDRSAGETLRYIDNKNYRTHWKITTERCCLSA